MAFICSAWLALVSALVLACSSAWTASLRFSRSERSKRLTRSFSAFFETFREPDLSFFSSPISFLSLDLISPAWRRRSRLTFGRFVLAAEVRLGLGAFVFEIVDLAPMITMSFSC